MIFGFGKKADDEDDFEEEEIDLVLFKGAFNGKTANLKANARLVEAGLIPAKEVVSDAMMRRADLVRIEPKGERTAILLSVDGINYPGGRLPKQRGLAVTQTIKLLSGLDTQQRKKPQNGGIVAEFQEKEFEVAVETTPVPGGERLVLKIRSLDAGPKTPEEIGMSDELRDKIREWTSHKSGLVVAAGGRRSGTTTTAFGILRAVDSYMYNIFTIGDFGRENISNVTEFECEEGEELDTSFTRCIRVEADVVFTVPIRNESIAKTLFDKQSRVTIISELTANDAASGITKLVELVGDPAVVAEGLRGVVGQKLIRKLCTACREPYRPNPQLLKKVGLPKTTKVLYRKPAPYEPAKGEVHEPCRKCGDLGYFGRIGMFELIEMTDEIKALVKKGANASQIKAAAREAKMPNLQQAGIRLVGEGLTSLEEVQRAFRA